MPRATAVRMTLLLLACGLCLVATDLVNGFRLFIVTDGLNRPERVVLLETQQPLPAGTVEVLLPSGGSYPVRCSGDPRAIAGASQLLEAAAPAIAAFPSDPAGRLVACSIGAPPSGIRGLLTLDPWNNSEIPVRKVLLAADITRTIGDPVVYTTRHAFLGSAYLAQFLAGCLVLGLLLSVADRVISWRRDITAAGRLLLKAPVLVMIPALTSYVAELIAHSSTKLLLTVSGIPHLLESLVYAPVMEEVVYRGLLYELVRKYSNPAFSSVFVSLAFAFAHELDAPRTMGIFIFGLAAQYLYIRYRSISLCILGHSVANGFALAFR